MLIIYAFYFFLIALAVFLSPLFVVREFGSEVWYLTINEIAYSAGTMIGGAVIAKWGGVKSRIATMALSCFMIGIASMLLGISGLVLFLPMMFLMGIFISFFSAVEMTLFQEKVEIGRQGRVFSIVQMASTLVMPVAMLLFCPLGDVIKVEWLFAGCGVLISVLGVYIFFNKALRKSAE